MVIKSYTLVCEVKDCGKRIFGIGDNRTEVRLDKHIDKGWSQGPPGTDYCEKHKAEGKAHKRREWQERMRRSDAMRLQHAAWVSSGRGAKT